MKILMLTPYLPYPLLSGGQIRTFNLLKQLASKHEITLFALIKDPSERKHIKQLQPFCKQVRVFKRSQKPFTLKNILKTGFSSYPFLVMRNHVPEAVEAVKTELATTQYDLIHAETFYMMPHIPETSTPILLVEQTIEYLGYESFTKKRLPPLRWLLNIDVKKIKHWEKYYWLQADSLVTMSQEDQEFIRHHVRRPEKVKVVSNGVDSAWFSQKKSQLPQDLTIVYVGTFKWLPNIEAARFLVEKVWPFITQLVPNAKLKIVGNAPTKEILEYQQQDNRIKVMGQVKDIRDSFTSAHLLLAPVFSGKGTRYKVLESMACGTPVVASTIAVEGLNLVHNKHALISNSPQEMTRFAHQLFTDRKLWQRLSAEGKKYVNSKFDWQIISRQLDQIYQSMG